MVKEVTVVVTVPDCTVTVGCKPKMHIPAHPIRFEGLAPCAKRPGIKCCVACSALGCMQDYFEVVFDNKGTLHEYHRLEGDPDASISPWSGDTRVITFSVPLSGVPDVVKRAIGTHNVSRPCMTHQKVKLYSGVAGETRSLSLYGQLVGMVLGGAETLRYVYAGTSTLTIQETQHKTWGADGALTVTSEPVLDFVGGSKYTTRAEFRVEAEGADCKVCSDLCHAKEPMVEYTERSREWHACTICAAQKQRLGTR